jgi:transposase
VRDNDGRKLDHQTLEAIRLRAVEQVDAGVPAAEVGRGLTAVGLHPKTIYTWLAKRRARGADALRAKPVPGPHRKLTDEQLAELGAVIAKTDPRDHGFAVALWTRQIVRQLIAARFAVSLTVASVGRTLHDLGFSAQRPLYRAEQADPAAVATWRQVQYPRIAAAATATGGTVYFVDEAGVRSDYHAGTSWAPVGQTPAVRGTGARFALNLISAISAQGALRFAVGAGTLTGARFIAFLKRLLHDAGQRGAGRCSSSSTAIRCTARRRWTASSTPPTARCGCTGCRPTPRSSTRTSGCRRTSSTTGWPPGLLQSPHFEG